MAATTLINGKAYSFANVKIDAGGKKYVGFQAINWKDSLKPSEVRSNSAVAAGRTIGEYTASGDFEIVTSEYVRLITNLGTGFGAIPFNIGVQYYDDDLGIVNVEIIAARIDESDYSNGKGPDASTVKATLSIVDPIKINGISKVAAAMGGDSGIDLGAALAIGL